MGHSSIQANVLDGPGVGLHDVKTLKEGLAAASWLSLYFDSNKGVVFLKKTKTKVRYARCLRGPKENILPK